MLAYFFFFLQAGDGIGFLTVTGFQACALPISATRPDPGAPPPLAAHRLHVDRWGWRGRGADDPARWRGRLPEPDADRAVQHGPRGAGTLQRRDGARLHRIGGPRSRFGGPRLGSRHDSRAGAG